jgi:5-methylcytosine-specific restriction endonuclease McrA
MTKQQALREHYCKQHGITLSELERRLQMRFQQDQGRPVQLRMCLQRGKRTPFRSGLKKRISAYPEFATTETMLTRTQWAELKAQYNHECLRCHKREPEIELVADHVLPKSKGGATTSSNIQPLCCSCNATKHNKHIDYRPPVYVN